MSGCPFLETNQKSDPRLARLPKDKEESGARPSPLGAGHLLHRCHVPLRGKLQSVSNRPCMV